MSTVDNPAETSELGGEDDIVDVLKTLLVEHSLPLWSREGWDHSNGGFVERLDKEGSPDFACAKRVRVQARQIYCFAKAARLGWYPEGAGIAMRGLEYLLAKAKAPDGRPGYVHLLASDGSVINFTRDTYDHAFLLLALSTVFELNQDAQVRAEIESLLAFLDQDLRSPNGGFIEGIPSILPRRQNPHMHLLEAMIATFDALGEPFCQTLAHEIFDLFVAKFYDSEQRILAEYFQEDWSKNEPMTVEPGHQAEWVWLLRGFERITHCSTGGYRSELLNSALRYRDSITGCLFDEGNADGTISKFTRRCWPQTEIAKAWIAQAEAGERGASAEARGALVTLYRHYLRHPVLGGWYDQFDREKIAVRCQVVHSITFSMRLQKQIVSLLPSIDLREAARRFGEWTALLGRGTEPIANRDPRQIGAP